MGLNFRFRSAINILPFVRLNLGKKGVSSVTLHAGRLSFNTKKRTARLSLGHGAALETDPIGED
jgi:hypothetical protein